MQRIQESSSDERRLKKRAYLKAYQQKHRARLTAQSRRWRERHRSIYLIRAWCRRRWKRYATPEESHLIERRHTLKKKYGLTQEEYWRLFEQQGGLCVICQKPKRDKDRYFCIDHEHGSVPVKIRGLLCTPCNTALGQVRDDIEVLRAMIEYLEGRRGARPRGGA